MEMRSGQRSSSLEEAGEELSNFRPIAISQDFSLGWSGILSQQRAFFPKKGLLV